jgi:hypothetical protein
MKLSIDTEILSKNSLTLGEFLVMLMGFYKIPFKDCYNALIKRKLIGRNIYIDTDVILSTNMEHLVEKILIESSDKLQNCGIKNFEELAEKLQKIYPSGTKAGTTYLWRGTIEEIVFKLKALIVIHDFTYTEEEAIKATKQYVESFKDQRHMSLLKYFILKTYENKTEKQEITSMFMTIIEDLRSNEEISG